MSTATDASKNELKHLLPSYCMTVEDTQLVDSQFWGVENSSLDCLNSDSLNCLKIERDRSNITWRFYSEKTGEVLDVYTADLPEYLDRNLSKLKDKFKQESTRVFKNRHPENINEIRACFYKTVDKIAELDFSDAGVEISGGDSLKYTLVFPERRMLMISALIDDEDGEVVYSFFINRELISTNAMELRRLIDGFNKFLQA